MPLSSVPGCGDRAPGRGRDADLLRRQPEHGHLLGRHARLALLRRGAQEERRRHLGRPRIVRTES